jgi:hypothetical protein
MKRLTFAMLVLVLILSACAPGLSEPVSSDNPMNSETPLPPTEPASQLPDSWVRGQVYLDRTDLLILESHPLQFMLVLQGNLPTPCHELRVDVSLPDEQNKVMVEVYSVVDPSVICIQVLAPFETNHALGSFPAGHYTLWINGNQVAEFDA